MHTEIEKKQQLYDGNSDNWSIVPAVFSSGQARHGKDIFILAPFIFGS